MSRKFAVAVPLMLAVAAITAPIPASAEEAPAQLKAEAQGLVKEYATNLQTVLKGALQSSGPQGAVSICHEQAPQIAADISRRSGWSVGRTSLKPRNPASAPDGYETKVMKEFQARIAKGEPAANLVRAEIVSQNGVKVFRFIKAIPTGQVCLTCHGTQVAPELKAKLQALYPGDKATGFKLGDMRGVFTLSKRL